MRVTTPTSSPPEKVLLTFRTSQPVGNIATAQEPPSQTTAEDTNQNDVKGPEEEQEVIGDIRQGLLVSGDSSNIPTSVFRYNEYPVRDTLKLSIVRSSQGKKRKQMEENDADENEVRPQLQRGNKNEEAFELLEKSNSSGSSKKLSKAVTKRCPNSGTYLTFDEVRRNRSRVVQRRNNHNRGYKSRDLNSQQISTSLKPVQNNPFPIQSLERALNSHML
ncbi:hypothetical protein FGB62_63g17 [Gracilaria domingensis]|nr:hypothetical protein FGB62_63g17 [Gracilaria domingensis]